MDISLQEQVKQKVRSLFGGRDTPQELLADLGIFLRGYGFKTGLRQMSDIDDLTDEQAKAALRRLPDEPRPHFSTSVIASLLE